MDAEPIPELDAEVIKGPWGDRTCFICPHHRDRPLDPIGVQSWCQIWDQPIDSETHEAEECSLFEVDPEKVLQ